MKIRDIRVNTEIKKTLENDYSLNKKNNHKILKKAGSLALVPLLAFMLSGCNRQIIDTKYGQNAALFSGDDSAVILGIKDWKDYEGEQYQINTDTGLLVLTSSFDTDLFFDKSNSNKVRDFANNQISPNGEVHDLYNNTNSRFNYELLDLHWKYNKAALFNENKSVIFNIANWRDYEGEQLQIVTEDGLVALLSSYNSKLFYDKQSGLKAEEFAKMYVGEDGKITEFGEKVDNGSFTNYNFIDLKYNFDKVIIFNGNKAVILPVSEWKDYEGEQLQIKVLDGPTIVTAAYDSILVDDSKSKIKANDIAANIADEVVDYTENKDLKNGFFNKTIIDLVYGFGNGVITNDRSATSIPVQSWNDYEGEQLQVSFPNGDSMLTSSMFLDLINNGTDEINANTLVDNLGEKTICKARNLKDHVSINKQLIDLTYGFNYALHVENGNVTILPLAKWKDYYNSNGYKSTEIRENPDGTRHKVVTTSEDSPNCEQLQLELPDGTVVLTSAYDTILLKTSDDVEKYAEMFRGKDGVITNLTPTFGEPRTGFNLKFFDLHYNFNYGIYNNGVNSQVFKINKWMDFADGEQVQVYFNNDEGMVSSYCNTTLVYAKDEKKVEEIAEAFAGAKQEKGKVYKYSFNK